MRTVLYRKCVGVYIYNDEQGLRRACPLQSTCYRYIAHKEGKKADETMHSGPYDDETSSCIDFVTLGKQ